MRTPSPPDPVATAAAQTASNRETAITQHELNMVNQNGPWGSVNYAQTGTSAAGTPTYTATTSLSPSQQAIFDKSQEAQGNLAGIAADQSKFLSSYLANGVDLSGLPALKTSLGPNYDATFNPNLVGAGKNFSTSLGPGYATSYAGADDFSADRRRVERSLWDRMAGDRKTADESLQAELTAKGIRPGSAAWDSEMARMSAANTDARLATIMAGGQEQARMVGMSRDAAMFGNDAMLSRFGAQNAASLARAGLLNSNEAMRMQAQGMTNNAVMNRAGFNNAARGQGVSEAFASRNQPINEITALLSGSQVSNPAQMGAATPQTGMANTNVAGIMQQDYLNRLNASQGMMGGIFGLGGSLLGAAGNAGGFGALFSDERLKTDVRRVGTTDEGVPVYTYRYVWGGPVHMGVMAQDVPEAAFETETGYLAVDYGKVA